MGAALNRDIMKSHIFKFQESLGVFGYFLCAPQHPDSPENMTFHNVKFKPIFGSILKISHRRLRLTSLFVENLHFLFY